MGCLIDYIGILGCGAVTPPSSFYLNSLPGISIKSIEALADGEKKTYLGVWDNIQTRAEKRFFSEVAKELSKRYKIKTITQNLNLGRLVDTATVTAQAAEYRGVMLNLDAWYDNSQYKASSLQSHYLQAAYFYSTAVQNDSVIKVFDYDLNTEIDSVTFDAVIGWNTVPINASYENRRIVIGVDATTLDTVSLTIPASAKVCYDCGSYIQGAKFAVGADPDTVTLGDNSYGLSVIYGVRCKYDSFVCNNLELFTMAWAYLLGSELMMERLASDTINKWTVDRKQAEELKAYYDQKFEEELMAAVSGVNLDEKDCCIECDPILAVRESNFW